MDKEKFLKERIKYYIKEDLDLSLAEEFAVIDVQNKFGDISDLISNSIILKVLNKWSRNGNKEHNLDSLSRFSNFPDERISSVLYYARQGDMQRI